MNVTSLLFNLSEAKNFQELSQRVLSQPNQLPLSNNPDQDLKISKAIEEFLNNSKNQLTYHDLAPLKQLKSLVHEFAVEFAQHNINVSTLEKTIALSINLASVGFAEYHLKDFDKINSISNELIRYQAIAQFIARYQIPINDLPIGKHELKTLAPYLTYLDCRNAFLDWKDKDIQHFLKSCKNLQILCINSPQITQLPSLPSCIKLNCSNCTYLKKIESLPNCSELICNRCPSLIGITYTLQEIIDKTSANNSETKIRRICEKYDISNTEYLKLMEHYKNRIDGHRIANLPYDSDTPLIKAVKDNNFGMVRVLHELGADLNKPDSHGNTPIINAINYHADNFYHGTNINMLNLLLKLGANVNWCGSDGNSPLMFMTENNRPAYMLELLLNAGADPNKCNNLGQSPIMQIQFSNRNLKELLIEHGADWEYAEEANKRIVLAHIWGIKGATRLKDKKGIYHDLDLEGFQRSTIKEVLLEHISDFFTSINLDRDSDFSLSAEIEDIIEDAFQNAVISRENANSPEDDFFDYLYTINSSTPSPFIIFGGSDDHAVSIILFQNKLIICNRGQGRKANTAQLYNLPKQNVTEDILRALTTTYSDMKAFNKMISNLNLVSIEIDGYNQKDQSVGNCTWTSAKGAFGVVLKLLLETSQGKIGYKKFTAFSRQKSLNDYLSSSKAIDDEIIKKIKTKKDNKSGLELSPLSEEYLSKLVINKRKRIRDT